MTLLEAIAWLGETGQPATDEALAALVPRWQLAGLRQLLDAGDVVTVWPAGWDAPGYRLSEALGGSPVIAEAEVVDETSTQLRASERQRSLFPETEAA